MAGAATVTAGDADAAAIHCVTFALLTRSRPAAVAELHILAHTASSPTSPFPETRVTRVASGYERRMTHEELAPFVGRTVAAHLRGGDVLTGRLRQPDVRGPYEVHSIDGEVPPIVLLSEEIDRIDA